MSWQGHIYQKRKESSYKIEFIMRKKYIRPEVKEFVFSAGELLQTLTVSGNALPEEAEGKGNINLDESDNDDSPLFSNNSVWDE